MVLVVMKKARLGAGEARREMAVETLAKREERMSRMRVDIRKTDWGD
jgi:hypothetical protein